MFIVSLFLSETWEKQLLSQAVKYKYCWEIISRKIVRCKLAIDRDYIDIVATYISTTSPLPFHIRYFMSYGGFMIGEQLRAGRLHPLLIYLNFWIPVISRINQIRRLFVAWKFCPNRQVTLSMRSSFVRWLVRPFTITFWVVYLLLKTTRFDTPARAQAFSRDRAGFLNWRAYRKLDAT